MSAPEKKKEVKKGHYVPSRYKQAAVTISHQSSHFRDKSPRICIDAQAIQTPCNSSQDSSTSKSSASLDSHVLSSLKSVRSNHYKKNKFYESIRPQTSVKGRKKNDSFNQTLAEAEMDILYAEYLQMAFLESEAKKNLELKSESAMEKLSKLCSLTSMYLSQVQSQAFTLELISTLIRTQEHLQKQEDVLKPLFEVIPTLRQRYRSLAEAVNIVKHKLVVKDVLLPEPGQEGDILKILQEMQEFFSRFFEEYPCHREIVPMVEALRNCSDAGRHITEALRRGFDLLMEARDLYFTEASLALSSVSWQP